jgi:glycosyltransferase involved in cell wall biosynthesis
MIRLFKSVDVYVSPYRGEGFGLTILEAMATGLPPIVTKYGPSVEFCPEDCAYFVEAQETECRTHNCGNMRLFGHKTVVKAKWAEPNIQSLSAQMYLAYTDRVQLEKKSTICQKYAEYYTWDKIADKIIKRISEITR